MADYLERAYRILNESRDSALDAARKVRERLNKDPLFASLENECRKLAFEKARLASQNRDISTLNAKYEELSARRAKRMEELGYSAADLKPKFSCELCRDTGKANGKDCVCLKKIVYAVLSEGQDIPCGEEGFLTRPRLDVLTADARDAYKKLYALLNRYALSFPEVKKIYTLTGAVGVGKSYAAGAVSHALMRRGFSVLFLNAVRLNEIFLEYHLAPLHLKQSVFAPLTEADLRRRSAESALYRQNFLETAGQEKFQNNQRRRLRSPSERTLSPSEGNIKVKLYILYLTRARTTYIIKTVFYTGGEKNAG